MPLGPLAKLIPGAAATRDMATLSGAQSELKGVRLPANVQTKIFYGDNDNLIDYTTKGAKQMAENLNAQVYYLAGEHTTTVPSVASHTSTAGSVGQTSSAVRPLGKEIRQVRT